MDPVVQKAIDDAVAEAAKKAFATQLQGIRGNKRSLALWLVMACLFCGALGIAGYSYANPSWLSWFGKKAEHVAEAPSYEWRIEKVGDRIWLTEKGKAPQEVSRLGAATTLVTGSSAPAAPTIPTTPLARTTSAAPTPPSQETIDEVLRTIGLKRNPEPTRGF